jgi:5'-nucleotidase / UDP-sugar diphosphatase
MKSMTITRNIITLFFITVVIGFGCTENKSIKKENLKPLKITILFFNDIHGYLSPFTIKNDAGEKVEVGGIARIAYLVDEIERENNSKGVKTFILIAGDILQGTPMSTVYKGKPDVESFNLIGVDAMTVGNHEFDFGLENFLSLKNMAQFPIISSNIIYKESKEPLCDPSASFDLGENIKLTVIGATTKELLVTTKPTNVTKLDVFDPLEKVSELFEKAKDNGPVVLLSHSRHETDRALAEAVPGLLAIIAGHDQILFSPRRESAGVPVFEAFEKGKYLGRLDIEIDRTTKKAKIAGSEYIPVSADVPKDKEVDELVTRYSSQLDDKFKEVIGKSAVFMDGERGRIRYEETNLGNFTADILREYSGADMALINAGSLRASIDEGPVTVEGVFNAMPYSNEIVTTQITGEDLIKILTRSVMGTREDEDGGFMHVSGLKFTIAGKEVKDILIGPEDSALDLQKIYALAITDFIASGGDGYAIFKDKPQIKTGLPLRELLVDTIRERKVISAKVEGRIVRE